MRLYNVILVSNIFRLFIFFGTTKIGKSLNMMVLWGNPTSLVKDNKKTVVNWDECVSNCENDPRCIFAYSKAKTPTTECYVYYFNKDEQIIIQLTNGTTDTGIVVLKKNNTDQCAASKYDNFPIISTTSDGAYLAKYGNIEEIDTITFKQQQDCGDNEYKLFERISATACLKSTYTYCGDGEIAGVESQDEIQYINEQALPYLGSTGYRYIWLAILRRNTCMRDPKPAKCYPQETNAFQWIDPEITGNGGLTPWMIGKPDNKTNYQCIRLGVTREKRGDLYAAAVDDVDCLVTEKEDIFGFICSKYL